MTRQNEAEIEILVCTPASGVLQGAAQWQDARYRTIARAYERFAQQPVTRIDIVRTPVPTPPGPSTPLVTASPVLAISEAYRQLDTTAPPLGSGLSTEFWTLSFDSVCDNVQSPRVTHTVIQQEAEEEDEDQDVNDGPSASAKLLMTRIQPRTVSTKHSYVSPDDYIPDSQPEASVEPGARKRRLTLDDDIEAVSDVCIEETRILESQDLDLDQAYGNEVVDDIEDIDDDGGDALNKAWAGSPDLSAMPLDLDPLEDSLLEEEQGSQQLPQLPLARQPLSQKSANSQQSLQNAHNAHTSGKEDRADHHGGHIPSSLPDEAGKVVLSSVSLKASPLELPNSSSLPSVPLTSPRRRWAGQPHRYQHNAVDDIEDADQTDSGASFARPAEPSAPVYARHDSDLRILSPEPPVGCSHLSAASLVTERLAKLAHDLDLTHRFTKVAVRDTSRTRQGPFDRGYWALDTSTWPAGLRQRSWDFLAKYVSRGDAGWGVWCSRRSRDDWQLRLHCFEATAGHTYLLLYLASQRQVLTTGVVWMDSSGSPAITIPPRKRKDDGSSRPSSRSTSRLGTAGTTTA